MMILMQHCAGCWSHLLLNSRVPPGVQEEDVGGSREIEGNAASLERHQEDFDGGVMRESVDHLVPVVHAHAALQPHTADPHLHCAYLLSGPMET